MKPIRKKKPLKLFVWEDVFCDYSCGIAFALARDVEHARKLIAGSMAGDFRGYVREQLAKAPDVVTRRPHGGQSSGGG